MNMTTVDFLTCLSILMGVLSAIAWFYSAIPVSREKELTRRNRMLSKRGMPFDHSGLEILDGDSRYDLVGTLRHQSRWSKWGALFAAIAIFSQAMITFLS